MMSRELIERGEMTDRVRRARARIFENAPVLSTLRLKVAMEVYQKTDWEPALIRRAKLFERYLQEMPIFIQENPIAGNITEHLVAVYPQPEYRCEWMLKQDRYGSQLGDISYTEEDCKAIEKAKAYWQDKCVYERALEVFRQAHKERLDPIVIQNAGLMSDAPVDHALGTQIDYGKVLNKGLNGVKAEVETEIAKLVVGLQEDERKRTFYNSVLLCINAVTRWAGRYADLAKAMAQKESDLERKRELERITEACQWVPANPARNFFEAVQSFWFVYAASHVMDIGISHIPGRLGQLLDPFYQRERGKLSHAEAIELLEFLFLKMQAIVFFRDTRYWHGGFGQTNIHITLGGVTADGEDATCDVDWLLLETQRRVRCIQPTISVLVHNKMSQEFLLKCVEVIKDTGLGQPAFMNNDIAIQQVLHHHPGASIEEARDVVLYGCVPSRINHRTDNLWGTAINMAKILELAMNNGKDPFTGVQIGPETGKAESFQSYEEFELAMIRQLQYFFATYYFELIRLSHTFHTQIVPRPLESALIDDCIKKGKDLTEGGGRYQFGGGGLVVGMIDVANSLAAIKKLVFEDRRITLGELTKALDANFEGNGYDEIHSMCLKAPKYGNDDIYVDAIAKKWYRIFNQEATKSSDNLGRPLIWHAFSISYHFAFGYKTKALPSGRKALVPLTDATASAMPGTDMNGPTALAKSAARAVDATQYTANHLNMKFHPSALATTGGMTRLLALIKTYMDLGGYHIQFNVVSSKTLRDAQAHPENYRSLQVRVAGFSAIYVLLDKMVQDEIIKRSEFAFEQ